MHFSFLRKKVTKSYIENKATTVYKENQKEIKTFHSQIFIHAELISDCFQCQSLFTLVNKYCQWVYKLVIGHPWRKFNDQWLPQLSVSFLSNWSKTKAGSEPEERGIVERKGKNVKFLDKATVPRRINLREVVLEAFGYLAIK